MVCLESETPLSQGRVNRDKTGPKHVKYNDNNNGLVHRIECGYGRSCGDEMLRVRASTN
jgi:hypothetical protein